MKTYLFDCVHNAGRSQMAAAWFNHLADPHKARAVSAGTQPGAGVHPEVLQVLRESGIDLADARPRLLTDELAREASLLVTMGCGEACPYVPGLKSEDWPLEDPKGKSPERVREIRDEVRQRVEELVRRDDVALPASRGRTPQLKRDVLFVCIHNSDRSQMAEAFLRDAGGDLFNVESAGLEPGVLNPAAVEAMREVGFDISRARPQAVMDLFKAGRGYSYVITVCDDAAGERCPIFPGGARRLQLGVSGSLRRCNPRSRLKIAREVRDEIRLRIRDWVAEQRMAVRPTA